MPTRSSQKTEVEKASDFTGLQGHLISQFIADIGRIIYIAEQYPGIGGRMQEIEDAIKAEDGYNPVTGKYYAEYIDLESWADKYLVEEITRNNGGGSTRTVHAVYNYPVKREFPGFHPASDIHIRNAPGRVLRKVWDYDKGYGNASGYNKNTRDLAFLTLHMDYTSWFYYLYQHEDFVEMVKKEYREKFSDYLTVMAVEKADEYEACPGFFSAKCSPVSVMNPLVTSLNFSP